ncbi:hypothetical protein GALMADRAFT_235712 [Galerina marginata CBS 339.88]|uniref:Uncharacterized protein n=1 Tax=Galerina marginata (strain CBS 339.88) TaxID=685588 RepID=A0A067TUE5_GALM3|nr:hypothetical protein GALMADRAFT_235712 [Galerina marginata CBS 339.88]
MSRVINDTYETLSSLPVGSLSAQTLMAILLFGVTVSLVLFRKASLRIPLSSHAGECKGTVASGDLAEERNLNKDREFGEWNPVKFRYPSIEAYPQKLAQIKPIPYRPFRWGAYHVTMGIRSMPWSDWIELDKDHGAYHRIKSHRLKTRGQAAVRVLSDQANAEVVKGGGEAAVELVHELAEYLSRRYPGEFQVIRHSKFVSLAGSAFCDWGWEDLPPIQTVTITSLDVSYQLPLSVDDGIRATERAMEIAGLMIQDDLALMIEGVDGRYYFQAGSICLPGFWRMQDKIGQPLDDIHITGNVPQYKEKLQTSLERFFRRLPVDKPVIRNNYFIQTNRRESGAHELNVGEDADAIVDPEELAWAKSTLGSEDAYEHGSVRRNTPRNMIKAEAIGDADVEWIRLRSERQTLRRLPRSGAVVFTIRTYLTPVTTLGREKGVPGRMASAVRSWTDDVGEYKGKDRGGWWGPLLKYLDECHAAQGAGGAEEKGYPL